MIRLPETTRPDLREGDRVAFDSLPSRLGLIGCRRRAGYTLLEMMIASGAATILLVGLASALSIASSALDEDGPGRDRADTVEVTATITADLGQATAFTERTANAVTFVVPDRAADGTPETIRYAWSGTPGDPLTVSVNGGAASNLVEDVQEFDLTYVTGLSTPQNVEVHLGYEHVYPDALQDVDGIQVATRTELGQPATLESITVYAGNRNNSDLRVAVYSDSGGEPGTLLVESGLVGTSSAMEWITVDLPDTALAPGHYWLSVGFEHRNQRLHVSRDGGAFRTVIHDAVGSGFLTSWGTSDVTNDFNLSIYATYHTN